MTRRDEGAHQRHAVVPVPPAMKMFMMPPLLTVPETSGGAEL